MAAIYVDADACPVVALVEEGARRFGLPVTLLCDEHHLLRSDTSEVRVVASGADAVDLALVNLCRQDGLVYTDENIDRLLMERHLARKTRRASGKHHLHGPARRTREDDARFAQAFERLLEQAVHEKKETD